jgi:hypothetical protein
MLRNEVCRRVADAEDCGGRRISAREHSIAESAAELHSAGQVGHLPLREHVQELSRLIVEAGEDLP